MYDLLSHMCRCISRLSHPTLYMSYTWAIFQASLLFHLQVSAYCLVGFVLFFYAEKVGRCKLFVSLGLFWVPVLLPRRLGV
jgi:hypothetical protein